MYCFLTNVAIISISLVIAMTMLSQVLSLGLLAASAAAAALPAASNSIPGKFIVRLKPDVESHLEAHTEWVSHIHARNLARRGSSDTETVGIEKTYSFADFEGYAGSFDEETLEAIKANPDVSIYSAKYSAVDKS